MYEKEITQNENRIEKMKAEGRDEYDIRKMVDFIIYCFRKKIIFNFSN